MLSLRRGAVLSVCLVATLTGGCDDDAGASHSLRVGQVTFPGYALAFVAEDLELFAQERVAVTFQPYPSGRDALGGVLAGEIDLAPVYPAPFVRSAMEGAKLAVVASISRAEGLTAVVGRPGLAAGAAGLRGLTLGISARSSSEQYAQILLAEAGLERRQVRWHEAGQERLVELFAAGELDAASLWLPHLLRAERARPGAVLLKTEAYSEMGILAGKRETLEAKSEAVSRFLAGLRRAQLAVEADPALLTASLQRRMPDLSSEDLARIVAGCHFEVSLSNLMLSLLRQEAHWLENEGMVRAPNLRVRGLLYPEPLERVAPEAVTLLPLVTGSP